MILVVNRQNQQRYKFNAQNMLFSVNVSTRNVKRKESKCFMSTRNYQIKENYIWFELMVGRFPAGGLLNRQLSRWKNIGRAHGVVQTWEVQLWRKEDGYSVTGKSPRNAFWDTSLYRVQMIVQKTEPVHEKRHGRHLYLISTSKSTNISTTTTSSRQNNKQTNWSAWSIRASEARPQ